MGRTLIEIIVANVFDQEIARRDLMKEEEVRSIQVPDALVDTGATHLCLPVDAVAALGLRFHEEKNFRTASGESLLRLFIGAFLTIMGRSIETMVVELPHGSPALIGYVPLEQLDLVVDSQAQQLIPNPAHDGKWMLDLF